MKWMATVLVVSCSVLLSACASGGGNRGGNNPPPPPLEHQLSQADIDALVPDAWSHLLRSGLQTRIDNDPTGAPSFCVVRTTSYAQGVSIGTKAPALEEAIGAAVRRTPGVLVVDRSHVRSGLDKVKASGLPVNYGDIAKAFGDPAVLQRFAEVMNEFDQAVGHIIVPIIESELDPGGRCEAVSLRLKAIEVGGGSSVAGYHSISAF